MYFKFTKDEAVRDITNKMYTIDDIKRVQKDIYKPCRDLPKICVIDDNDFPYLSILNNEGYRNITVYKDFTQMEEFEKYDVILCDVAGVGLSHHKIEQGAAIAKDLHKCYPLKKIFIYSGNNVTDFANDIPSDIRIIPKQCAPIEITGVLDDACSYLWNPEKAWIFLEDVLRKDKICNKNIAFIEHMFVKSFLEKKNYFYSENKYLDAIIKSVPIIEMFATIIFGILGAMK